MGQLWRAAEASGGVKFFSERMDPSILACRGSDAVHLAGAVAVDSAEIRNSAKRDCPIEQIAKFT